jgi:UDP-2,3-diacylglucosamine pyrophosphatase LpxH
MRTYYFISDLHIGGDEALGVCDFENELVAFLQDLATRTDEDVELIIVGDAFGLWEFTQVDGNQKVDVLIGQFPRIFDAFKSTGEKITITLLPGNHDYELACYPEFADLFAKYNIHLEQNYSITRELGDRKLWIEHGNQHDRANEMPDYGNPHAQPIGYYVTGNVVGGAGQRSERGRYNWLKDIQSVYPTEAIPGWVFSNYFYREMSPLLRWLLLPFLICFGLTLFVLVGSALDWLNVTETNVFLNNRFLDGLGIAGSLLQLVLTINSVLIVEALILALPLYFIFRDARATVRRFGVAVDPAELTGQKEEAYVNAAQKVFDSDPSIAAFIYGHTHSPFVKKMGERVVINTGTWMKKLKAVKPRLGLLPRIYVPSYRINYFRVSEQNGDAVIDYHKIAKQPNQELSFVQRVLTLGRTHADDVTIPERTIVRRG